MARPKSIKLEESNPYENMEKIPAEKRDELMQDKMTKMNSLMEFIADLAEMVVTARSERDMSFEDIREGMKLVMTELENY